MFLRWMKSLAPPGLFLITLLATYAPPAMVMVARNASAFDYTVQGAVGSAFKTEKRKGWRGGEEPDFKCTKQTYHSSNADTISDKKLERWIVHERRLEMEEMI